MRAQRYGMGMATPPTVPDPTTLPEVMDLAAVATAFRMTRSGARRAVLRGDLGPYSRVGRRIFLRRVSVLDALKSREVVPPPRDPPPVPVAPEWARGLLRRGRRAPEGRLPSSPPQVLG